MQQYSQNARILYILIIRLTIIELRILVRMLKVKLLVSFNCCAEGFSEIIFDKNNVRI